MKIFFLSLAIIFIIHRPRQNSSNANQRFDREKFYNTLSSENLSAIDRLLGSIKAVPLPGRDAYEGALLMKKAGLLENKKNKLTLFRTGKQQLDSSISSNNQNCEYRLLRLIIQENAPPVLGYNKQINEDCMLIRKKYSSSPVFLKNIIFDYSKKSKKLDLSGL